jgi:hypothetical protein
LPCGAGATPALRPLDPRCMVWRTCCATSTSRAAASAMLRRRRVGCWHTRPRPAEATRSAPATPRRPGGWRPRRSVSGGGSCMYSTSGPRCGPWGRPDDSDCRLGLSRKPVRYRHVWPGVLLLAALALLLVGLLRWGDHFLSPGPTGGIHRLLQLWAASRPADESITPPAAAAPSPAMDVSANSPVAAGPSVSSVPPDPPGPARRPPLRLSRAGHAPRAGRQDAASERAGGAPPRLRSPAAGCYARPSAPSVVRGGPREERPTRRFHRPLPPARRSLRGSVVAEGPEEGQAGRAPAEGRASAERAPGWTHRRDNRVGPPARTAVQLAEKLRAAATARGCHRAHAGGAR